MVHEIPKSTGPPWRCLGTLRAVPSDAHVITKDRSKDTCKINVSDSGLSPQPCFPGSQSLTPEVSSDIRCFHNPTNDKAPGCPLTPANRLSSPSSSPMPDHPRTFEVRRARSKRPNAQSNSSFLFPPFAVYSLCKGPPNPPSKTLENRQ